MHDKSKWDLHMREKMIRLFAVITTWDIFINKWYCLMWIHLKLPNWIFLRNCSVAFFFNLQHYHNGYAHLYRSSQISWYNVKHYLNVSRHVLFDHRSNGKIEKWWKCDQNPEKKCFRKHYMKVGRHFKIFKLFFLLNVNVKNKSPYAFIF